MYHTLCTKQDTNGHAQLGNIILEGSSLIIFPKAKV